MVIFPRRLVTIIMACIIGLIVLSGCGQAASSGGGNTATKKFVIAFVPKLINIGYFNAMKIGLDAAARDLGVTLDYEGPTTADASLQVKIIKNLIAKHVDAIAISPDDPAVVGPALQEAQAQGIKVYTSDSDAAGTVRSFFVAQALNTDIGNATIDALADAMGKQGEWAIDSCGAAASSLNAWIAAEKSRAATMYPQMTYVTTLYSGEDIAKSVADTKDLINSHPNLKGVIGQCSTSAPGTARAITELHKIGQVFATGDGVPNDMKPYIENGAVKSFVLWDPSKLGYLTIWAGLQILQGKSFAAVNTVPTLGQVTYDATNKVLLLGKPITFDKSNVSNYNF